MNLSTASTLISPFFNQQYPDFQTLWKSEKMSNLFIVRAPQALSTLDRRTYIELIQTRVDGLIQDWIVETSISGTQKLLTNSLDQLDSTQSTPLATSSSDIDIWRQVWSNLLIHDNWRFQERMSHYGVTFPLTKLNPDSSNYSDWIDVHNETTLEAWLMTLIA